jgi:hypothetical protein
MSGAHHFAAGTLLSIVERVVSVINTRRETSAGAGSKHGSKTMVISPEPAKALLDSVVFLSKHKPLLSGSYWWLAEVLKVAD